MKLLLSRWRCFCKCLSFPVALLEDACASLLIFSENITSQDCLFLSGLGDIFHQYLHSSLLFSISFLRALSLSHISQLKITGWKFDIKYNSLKKEKFQKWAFSSNKLYLLLIKRLSITCGEMTYGCSNFLGLDLFKKITLYPTNL